MDMTARSEIKQALQDRTQEIAQAWLEKLAQLTSTPLENDQVLPSLEGHTERLISALVSEPFKPEAARKVGLDWEMTDNLQPQDMITIQTCLANAFTKELEPEDCAALYPHVLRVLAWLQVGFFMGKAQRAARFNMDAMSKMGHDLKTPINAITGFSRVILKGIDGPITEFQQQDLTSIYDAGKKLLDMINDVFETAKSDAAKTELYDTLFDVADLLGDVVKTGQPVLARREHILKLSMTGDLGKMQAAASEVRWVLLSLLFHATRLTDKGTVVLTAAREQVDKQTWLIFEVSKALTDQPVASDAQAPQAVVEEAENDMAIGLVTALRFCKDMGGTLAISEGEALAKYTVRLPARAAMAE